MFSVARKPSAPSGTSISSVAQLLKGNRQHRTPLNGTSWTSVSIPNPTGGFGGVLSGVAAVASNDVWAVGSSGFDNSQGAPVASTLIEHYNGTSWSIVASPNPTGGGALTGVTAISANNIWAVGHMGFGRGGNLIEHYNGTSWSIVPSPSGGTSIAAFSANNVYVVGGGIEHWDGTSWTTVSDQVPANFGSPLFSGVITLSTGDAIAVGLAQPLTGPNNYNAVIEQN